MAVRRFALWAAALLLMGCEAQSDFPDVNVLPDGAIQDLNAWDPGVMDPGFDPGIDPGGDSGTDPGLGDVGGDVTDPGLDPGVDSATDPGGGVGKAEVQPGLIDFGYVQMGQSLTGRVFVKNVGDGELSVTRFQVTGTTRVFVELDQEGTVSADGIDYKLSEPIRVAPGATIERAVRFTPNLDAAMDGELRIWTSDPDQPDGTRIFLVGNRKRVCIRTIPGEVDFGFVTLGAVIDVPIQVEACGLLDLEVTDISLDAAGLAGGMSLVFDGFAGGVAPSVQSPVTIPSGTRATFQLRYAPTQASPVAGDGTPQALRAQLAIESNAFAGGTYLPVTGAAVETPCAVPVIDVVEDGALYVGDLVHLSGLRSVSPFAAVDSWVWTVEGPSGAPAVVLPFAGMPEVVLPLGAPGDYVASLEVGDSDGNPSCSRASIAFRAIPSNRALVALSWRPASGVPVAPLAGPDVDLHLLHPNAAGPDRDSDGKPDGWFDGPWDCYWGNPMPDKATWGSSESGIDDRVELVQSSEDGLISEIIRVGMFCQAGRIYRIGAHVYSDGGLGAVDATLHVWDGLGGGVSSTQRLSKFDMWEAATLACPGGNIVVASPAVIKKNYVVGPMGSVR